MTAAAVEFTLLIRDTRHMSARAATDLADWLERLELEGKASRSIYQYHRYVAGLLRRHAWRPDKTTETINALLARLDQIGKEQT